MSPPTPVIQPQADATPASAELDAAKDLIEEYKLDAASAILDRTHARFAGTMTPYERYRLLANRGHIKRLKGDLQEAAKLFLKAHLERPDLEDACALQLMAYQLLNDDAKCGELAQKFRDAHPPRDCPTTSTTTP